MYNIRDFDSIKEIMINSTIITEQKNMIFKKKKHKSKRKMKLIMLKFIYIRSKIILY